MARDFATDLIERCRWARAHNGGHPLGAWSTREQLAVALVLRDRAHLDAMGYTPTEAAQSVYDGMAMPPAPAHFPAWLDDIRAALDAPAPAGDSTGAN